MRLWVKKPDECHKERQQTPNPDVTTVYTTIPDVGLPFLGVDTLRTLAAPPPPTAPLDNNTLIEIIKKSNYNIV